jgi:hypothetical protein
MGHSIDHLALLEDLFQARAVRRYVERRAHRGGRNNPRPPSNFSRFYYPRRHRFSELPPCYSSLLAFPERAPSAD